MCGIAGIISRSSKKIDKGQLKRMTDALSHRGPDGEGHWISENQKVGFGHRRLSIIDLSEKAKQPMRYKDRYTITFNGEIYNYLELKIDLEKNGYIFNSKSDTEVLLALFDNKGSGCLKHLDGMFAFAIYDNIQNKIFCARDRFGEKPFYYYLDGNFFAFASEMKALWAIGISKKINNTKLNLFLEKGQTYSQDNPDGTFYDNVKVLQHSHFIELDLHTYFKEERYWDIDITNQYEGSFENALNTYSFLFDDSVKKRLRADVPIGSSLSGGLDSSSIVKSISKQISNKSWQYTYSAKFPGFIKDEGAYADMVVSHLKNIKGISIFPKYENFEKDIAKIIYFQEEPIGSTSIYAQWEVYKRAAMDVKVLIDGQGADEILAGYKPIYSEYFNQLFWHNRKKYIYELKEYNRLHIEKQEGYKENESIRMKLGRIRRKINNNNIPYSNNHVNEILYNYTMNGNLQTLLRYADRNSMAHSIEVRLPFLSHKLVEFCFSLPIEYKLNMGWTKYILRMSIDNFLPKEIVWRKDKIGFEPPQKEWLNSDANYTNDFIFKKYIVDFFN